MYDLIIKNGKIVDYDEMTLKSLDIGIKEGVIVKIGTIDLDQNVLDAKGLIIAPGIIDSHMHEEKLNEKLELNYDISNHMLQMGVTTCVGGNCGFNFNGLEGVKAFKNHIKHHGSPVNYLLFAGYTTLREACGLVDRYREASNEEMGKILETFKAYYDLGVIGISFGLEYTPGISETEFLEFLSRLTYKDLLLSAHFRKDGKDAPDSIREMIRGSEVSGLPMRISHIGSCSAIGYMTESLDIIKQARDKGLPIDADCYPYDAFSTFIGSAVFDEGWKERLNVDYSAITLIEEPYKNRVCNKELFDKVRKDHPDMTVVAKVMNEDEVTQALKTPFVSIASDGILMNGQGHPRAAGTFPRVLGKYVRDEKALDLVDALERMTRKPAQWLGLRSKGEIKEGMDADLFIFDEDIIIDEATYENPTKKTTGDSLCHFRW